MEPIETDLAVQNLARLPKASLYAYMRQMRHSKVVEFTEMGGLTTFQTPVAHPWFNGVLAARPPQAGERQRIQAAIRYFKSRGVNLFTWWLEPHLHTAAWDGALRAEGFSFSDDTPGMAMDLLKLNAPPHQPDGFSVKVVEDVQTLKVWNDTFCQGYGIPYEMGQAFYRLSASLGVGLPLRYYLGYLNNTPMAASTLFLGAGVAGIYNVATLPEARGQGLGAILTLTPLLDAVGMGYRIGVLQSSEMGFNVYRRLGFEQYCTIENYYWSGEG